MAKEIINDTRRASFTHVEFILDETGSMSDCWDSTISGFNEYVNGLRQDKENDYRLSLVKFDSNDIKEVYLDKPIADVENLTRDTYIPGAMTNLNDAIGSTMTKLESRLRDENCNIIIIILTDGYENYSKEWSQKMVADLVERKKSDGWTITFLGANIDVQQVGRAYAMDMSNVKAYSTNNMGATMRGLSEATVLCANSATVGAASADFFAGTSDWTEGEDTDVSSVNTSPIGNMTFTNAAMVMPSVMKLDEDTDKEEKKDE